MKKTGTNPSDPWTNPDTFNPLRIWSSDEAIDSEPEIAQYSVVRHIG